MALVEPFDLPLDEQRRMLDELRGNLSIAVIRSKNPFNVGAIIRVAHSYLVREIFLVGTDKYYKRASMGMHRYENIVQCDTEAEFLDKVADRQLISIERDQASATIWEAPMPADCVMLFGSENDGLSEELLAASNLVLSIPMYGINHSFPVAIAAGMAMCEWARRGDPRGARGPLRADFDDS